MSGIAVSGLSHSWGARKALEDVSFVVDRGEFCALLGPNGAGKSTLFGLLTRLYRQDSGTIRVARHDLGIAPRQALAATGIVFQQPAHDPHLTVGQNLLYAAALHGLAGRAARLRMEETLQLMGMAERVNDRARLLNGGHRRRMEIAAALMHRPEVLLLDEPTAGLDPAARTALTAHVHALAASGMAILWATHLTDEVWPEDRLVILHRGRVLADGRAEEIGRELPLAERFLALTGGRGAEGSA